MEFEKYGPLAQSKEFAETQNTSWIPIFITLGAGILIGYFMIASIQQYQPKITVDSNQ